MRVVVTGGAGFIGSNICRTLGEEETISEIVAFDDLSTGLRANLEGTRTDLQIGDLCDFGHVRSVMDNTDAVIHLAARPSVPRSIADPLRTHLVNATGTMHVLEAARLASVKHFIVASSSSVYGASPTLPKHEQLKPSPLSPYAASKLAAEAYALAYSYSFGMPVLALRFFNVFGPHQRADHAYAAVIPAFMSAALAGEPLLVNGDGSQTRDFTYVGSVVAVIKDALARRVQDPEPVNLAFGSRLTLLELISQIEHIFGDHLTVEHRPSRPGDVHDSQADASRLFRLFPGIQPHPLDDALRSTFSWLRDHTLTQRQ